MTRITQIARGLTTVVSTPMFDICCHSRAPPDMGDDECKRRRCLTRWKSSHTWHESRKHIIRSAFLMRCFIFFGKAIAPASAMIKNVSDVKTKKRFKCSLKLKNQKRKKAVAAILRRCRWKKAMKAKVFISRLPHLWLIEWTWINWLIPFRKFDFAQVREINEMWS